MRTEAPTTNSHARDFISENAVRRVFGRRRASTSAVHGAPAESVHTVNGLPTDTTAGGADTPARTERQRPLRRWSVTDLLANAVVVPRDSMSHC